MANRVRPILLRFFVDEQEREVIDKKMKKLRITNLSHYLRKMALEGMIVQIDFTNLDNICADMSKISKNINQMTRRVNATDTVYIEDLRAIRKAEDDIWNMLKSILAHYHSKRFKQ